MSDASALPDDETVVPRAAETFSEVEDALLSRWPETRLEPSLERIEASALEKLVVTNTIPPRSEFVASPKVTVLSVASLLGRAIQSIHEETSVSSLFG